MSVVAGAFRRMGVEPAERSIFSWAALCLILLGAAAFALLNSAETLFLKRVGVEYLPLALLASSGLLVATTGLVGRGAAQSDRSRWLVGVMLGLCVALLPFVVLSQWSARGVFVACLLVARQVLPLGLLVFFLAMSDLVTGRQAKRLFPPLTAGITLGGISGSFASDPIARAVGIEGLLVVCSVLLAGAAGAGLRLRAARPRQLEGSTRAASGRSARGGSIGPAQIWRDSRLFRLLLVAIACSGALSPVLYFQFSYVADAATAGANAEQELLALYANFRGWLNVVMLMFQLWLSGRLYQRLGLPLSLLMWPTTYLVGFTWLGVDLALVAAIVSLGATRVAEDGMASSALRVLFNLFPEHLRSRAAGLLEGPVNRLGGVLGNGLVLFALATGGVVLIGALAIPLALIWFVAAVALWRAYPTLLLQASADRHLVGIGADKATLLDAGTLRALAPNLEAPDPRVCRATLDLVVDADPAMTTGLLASAIERAPEATRPLLVDALHSLVEPRAAGSLRSPDACAALSRVLSGSVELPAEQRADLLRVYARLTGGADTPRSLAQESIAVLEKALGDREASVRLVAIAELVRRGRPPPGIGDFDEVLRGALIGRDVLMRRTARKELRFGLLATQPEPRWEERLGLLGERLEQRADRAETAEALVAVARRHDGATQPCARAMVKHLDDPDPRVRAAVLSFVGHADVAPASHRLIAGLGARHGEVVAAAQDGLVALGPKAALDLLVEHGFGPPSTRRAVFEVLQELDVEPATLEQLYQRQLDSAYETLLLRVALGPDTSASLLVRRLEERIGEGVGLLLAFLGVLQQDDRIGELERRLRRAPDERSRDILVEALEALLTLGQRSQLGPLLESAAWETSRRRLVDRIGHRLPTEEEAWDRLRQDSDPLTRRLARTFAPRRLEGDAPIGDASQMLDPMEIAVRLQDVPAFDRLSTQQLVSLAEVLSVERYEAGQVVFHEGDEGEGLYFVLEGSVALSKQGEELERLGPGTFFGELSTLDGVPRPDTARACEAVRLLCLEREELLVLMEEAPSLGIGLSQHLSLRVRGLLDRLQGSGS